MSDIDEARDRYEQAERAAQQLMRDRDESLQAVRDEYDQDLRDANATAAALQKEYLDALVADASGGA